MQEPVPVTFGIRGFTRSDGTIDIQSVDMLPIHSADGTTIGCGVVSTDSDGNLVFHGDLNASSDAAITLMKAGKQSFSIEGHIDRPHKE